MSAFEGYRESFLTELRTGFTVRDPRAQVVVTGVREAPIDSVVWYGRPAWQWDNFAAVLRCRDEERLHFRYRHARSPRSNHCARCGESRYQRLWAIGVVHGPSRVLNGC